MAELPRELVALTTLAALQDTSRDLGVTVADALDLIDAQRATNSRLRAAISEAVHQAQMAEKSLREARRAVQDCVGGAA